MCMRVNYSQKDTLLQGLDSKALDNNFLRMFKICIAHMSDEGKDKLDMYISTRPRLQKAIDKLFKMEEGK